MTSPATHDCDGEARWTEDATCRCTLCHPSGPITVPRPSLAEWVRSRKMHMDYGIKMFNVAEDLKKENERLRSENARLRLSLRDRRSTGTIGPGARSTDPETSHMGAHDVKVRAGTQRTKILRAFVSGRALSARQAAELAEVDMEHSCWWKRVSELHQGGYLEDTGRTIVSPETGSAVETWVITEHGLDALARTETAMPPL